MSDAITIYILPFDRHRHVIAAAADDDDDDDDDDR